MDKSPEAFRTISEVAETLVTPAHVLRFWESRFPQIRPVKRAGGRRYYRPADVALLSGIRHLLHDEGMTIRGVQKILREQGVKYVAAMGGPLGDYEPDAEEDLALPVADATMGNGDGAQVVALETALWKAQQAADVDAVDPDTADLDTADLGTPEPETADLDAADPSNTPDHVTAADLPDPAILQPDADEAPIWIDAEPELDLAPLEPQVLIAAAPTIPAPPPRPVVAADVPARLAARIRALHGDLPRATAAELADLHGRLGLLHAQMVEAARPRR